MSNERQIRLLPLHIANKIAAGEVVERPASVVKELMENAIDAGATRIEVSVTAGGRKLIEIRDNGCGMDRENALLCIERQATSKIREVEDIERISTLGFRGEALPSIASVSRLTIRTRTAESDAGTELSVTGGTLQDVTDAGTPVGTTISVRDLFFNVPVRRKFLRAYQTEQAHIKSVFTLHALAHPEIGMRLSADSNVLAILPPGATLEERVRDLFGNDFIYDLRPIEHTCGDIRITGFAGLPTHTRNDRSEQYIFINGRPATAPVIAYALREAYPPLDRDRKPIVLIFIEMPPEDVDVNVHPTKREVRFNKPAKVREALIRAITLALGIQRKEEENEEAALPDNAFAPVPAPPVQAGPAAPAAWPCDDPRTRPLSETAAGALPPDPSPLPFPYPAPPLPSIPFPPRPPVSGENRSGSTASPSHPYPVTPISPPDKDLPLFTLPEDGSPWKWCRYIGQVDQRYLLLETDSGYVTVEPQAARERVLYEKLLEAPLSRDGYSQKLLIPESINLPAQDARRIRKFLPTLQGLGFGVEDFGDDHFMIESIPSILGDVSCRELLADIAHDLENAGTRRGSSKWREEIIAKAACKSVSGMRTHLSPEEAQKLVDDLAKTVMPYTCPRGRPTMIFTSFRELARKFDRSF